jgi:hypothetical protein
VVAAPAAGAELHFEDDRASPSYGTVGVHGLPVSALARLAALDLNAADRRALLSVRTAAAGEELPSILGERRIVGGALRFVPRFPFRSGLGYRARFDDEAFDRLTAAPAGTTPTLELRFEPAEEPGRPATRVEAVYPSAEVLPENQLRLYVWFSAPMRRRGIADGVRLIDEGSGEAVELSCVEVVNGLWDPSGRRLTLFFHPGRVKRGVGPHRVLGPPLREGGRYRLEIDAGLRDARGRPLAGGHVKRFAVGPPDRQSPDPGGWRLSAPATAEDPLLVDFPEPLDHGLLLRLLEVLGPSDGRLAGEVIVSRGETRWAFRPEAPWKPGPYRLRVMTTLEDLAGNTPERLFDEATGSARDPLPPRRTLVDLPFSVAPRR